MTATPGEIEKYVELLEEMPRSITRTIGNIDDARLQYRSDRQSWSANDILAHIRSCADVWGNSIEAMIAEDTPMLPDIHPRQWIKETNYPELSFHESFQAFSKQRERLLITLRKLSFEDWSRAATIAGRKQTVFTQARRMAKHEQEHCKQIESLLQRFPRR